MTRKKKKDRKSQTQSHLAWPPGCSFSARHPGCCILSSFVLWIRRMHVVTYLPLPPPSSVYVLFLFILSLISNLFPSSFICLASASFWMLIFPGIFSAFVQYSAGESLVASKVTSCGAEPPRQPCPGMQLLSGLTCKKLPLWTSC